LTLLQNQLIVKRSTLPGAGKGLFTKTFIAGGSFVIEYKGRLTTWKDVMAGKNFNGYVYYINRNHVVDAKGCKECIARYANDAKGITKVKGLSNNCSYTVINNKVFIKAIKNIQPGEELLVSYGKEYWDVVQYNNKLSSAYKKSVPHNK
jgi:SET domain-containing protein